MQAKLIQKQKIVLVSALALIFLFLAGPVLASDKWIHIRVQDGDDEEVMVNLPLSVIKAAASLIPMEEIQEEAEIALDDFELSWGDLQRVWQEVRDLPEATFVTVRTQDENVTVRKEGDYLVARTSESSDTEVNVKFPMAVVDALFSGPDGTLNFEAALTALADYGEGNLVEVRDGDDRVRIWIDDQNEAN